MMLADMLCSTWQALQRKILWTCSSPLKGTTQAGLEPTPHMLRKHTVWIAVVGYSLHKQAYVWRETVDARDA